MFIEGNEARSVMETLIGLLGAMRVLFRDDRLSFAQAVASYFSGYDAFRWSRRIMPVARHLVGERRVMLRQPLRFVWCLWRPNGRRVPCASS